MVWWEMLHSIVRKSFLIITTWVSRHEIG